MRIPRAMVVALAALFATPSFGQDGPVVRHHARPRIEVTPSYRFYRECVDGYRLVPRPAWGETVLMPFLHCRWVRE